MTGRDGDLPATPEPGLLATARAAATAAAEVHRSAAGRLDPSGWKEKGRADFVTEVDVEAERRIVEVIRAAYPGHLILAEEGGGPEEADRGDEADGSPMATWIIDPLDGTTNWLHGYPEYAASIAVRDADGPAAAVVLNSATGECFEAARGGGARRDGQAIRVSPLAELRLALVGTGFPFKHTEVLPAYLRTFETVLRSTSGVRRAGSAALDLCDVACGRLDAFFEFHLMPWDVAAGALVVREAGGRFETLPVPGLEPRIVSPAAADFPAGGFVAANPLLWAAFRELLPG